MDNHYAIKYRELYRNHWWWRARESAIEKAILNLPALSTNNDILDVGCGDGLSFDMLSRFGEPWGVEIDPLTIAEDSPWRDRIHLGMFDDHWQPGRKFGLILMLDVLEHIQDPAAALSKAVSLLADDGHLIITVPAFQSLWTSHDDLNHHYVRYTKAMFADLAEASQMRVADLRYLFHWTCPIKLAIRIREKLFSSTPKSPALPSRWINRLLLSASRFEQHTISRLPMPFGSSLLVTGSRSN